MRRFGSSDKLNALIAGFLAGLASKLDAKNRRQFLMILLLSRFSDSSYKMAENNGIVSGFKYGEIILFIICNIQQQIAMGYEKDTMNKAMYSWMNSWS